MADIAAIGFSVDTSQLQQGKIALEALAPAAQKVQTASQQVAQSLDSIGTAAAKGATSTTAAGKAANDAASGYDKMGKAITGAVADMTKFNALNDNLVSSTRKTANILTDLQNVSAQLDKVSTPFTQASEAYGKLQNAQKNGLITSTQYAAGLHEIERAFTAAGGTSAQFEKATETTASHLEQLKEFAFETGAELLLMITGGELINLLIETAKQIDEISKSATKLGVTVAEMQGLALAGKEADVALAPLTQTLNKVNETIALADASGKGNKGVFAFLGLSAKTLLDMPLPERLTTIADRMQKLNLTGDATALVLKKLGDGSGNLSNLFAGGGDKIRDAMKALDEFHGALTDLQAEKVDALEHSMTGVGAAFAALKTQLVAALAPILTSILNGVAAGLGAVAGAIQSLANGTSPLIPMMKELGTAMLIAFGPQILLMVYSLAGSITVLTVTIAEGLISAIYGAAAAMLVFTLSNPFTALLYAIPVVIAAIYYFRDEIDRALGVDVVQTAEQAANAIVNSFIAAYKAIVATWALLPSALGDIFISLVNVTLTAVVSMVNLISASINGFIDGINSKLGSLGVSVGRINDGLKATQIANPFGAQGPGEGKQGPTFPSAADRLQAAGGAAISAQMQVDNFAGFNTVVAKASEEVGTKLPQAAKLGAGAMDDLGNHAKGAKDKFQEIVDGAERTIAKLQAQKDAIGLSAEAADKLKYETQLLNEAQQKGISLTASQTSQLMGLADQMGALEAATKKAQEAFDFEKSTTKSFVTDMASSLEQGKSLWESFGSALQNVAKKLIDRGLNMLIDKFFELGDASKSVTGGGLSSGGGILSSLFGGIGKLFGFAANGATFNKGASAFANGGEFTNSIVSSPTMFAFANGGALGVMGEAGPEAVMPLKRGSDGSLGVQLHSANAGQSAPVTIAPQVNNHYTIAGAVSEEKIVAQIKATAEQTTADTRKQLVGWLNQYQRDGVLT